MHSIQFLIIKYSNHGHGFSRFEKSNRKLVNIFKTIRFIALFYFSIVVDHRKKKKFSENAILCDQKMGICLKV